jgi:hypothetical protein
MNTFTSHSLAAIFGAALVTGYCAYNTLKKITTPSVLAQPSKELKNEKSETLACRPVVVYRDRVKRDLLLPETVQKDPDKKVTASTKVPASDFPVTVTSVFDTFTGSNDLYTRADPLPWISAYKKTTLSVSYGFAEAAPTFHLSAQHQFLQIKAMRMYVGGHVFGDGYKFVEIGTQFNW